ncbi:hypothetical protein ACHAWF_011704, partial [Thalassiosira exigua]
PVSTAATTLASTTVVTTPASTTAATTAASTTAATTLASTTTAATTSASTMAATTLASTTAATTGPYEATVAAHYASWQWYDRSRLAAPKNIDFSKVDRVNFAFFQTDENGNIWGTDDWADSNLLFGPQNWNPQPGEPQFCSWDSPTGKACRYHIFEEGLVNLAHEAGAEIFPSLGGWSLSDAFVPMAANAGSRARFASKCTELISDYGFDGIDIDWEYPGYADHSGTPDDKENFNLLLDDVRNALDELGLEHGKYYKLTAALPCGPQHMANIDIHHVSSRLDELNLMSYDFGGSWSSTTSINAPLVYQGWGPQGFSVDDCVRNWIDAGGSREKINLGISFYGRSFAGATGLNQSHQGSDTGHWSADEGTPQFYNILAQLPNMISERDELTKTTYAYFPSGGLVSYDNERSICEKAEYAIQNYLNGFLIWELSGDLLLDLSTPLLDSINAKVCASKILPSQELFRPVLSSSNCIRVFDARIAQLGDPAMSCSNGSTPTSATSSTTATIGPGTTPSTTATTTVNGGCNRPPTCQSHLTAYCGPGQPCLDPGMCCSQWG